MLNGVCINGQFEMVHIHRNGIRLKEPSRPKMNAHQMLFLRKLVKYEGLKYLHKIHNEINFIPQDLD